MLGRGTDLSLEQSGFRIPREPPACAECGEESQTPELPCFMLPGFNEQTREPIGDLFVAVCGTRRSRYGNPSFLLGAKVYWNQPTPVPISEIEEDEEIDDDAA